MSAFQKMRPAMGISTRALGRRACTPFTAISRRPVRVTAEAVAKPGDSVRVHYTGKLDDGTVFDSSKGKDPIEFVIGQGLVIKGFDIAVTGLSVGGKRTSTIPPVDAYGEMNPDMLMDFPVGQAPRGLTPGAKVKLSSGLTAKVVKIDDKDVTLDMNHELAGKTLTFDVELVALSQAEKLAKATFGAGCFWSVELAFQRTPGVVTTEVGYCNGSVDKPTYDQVCDGNTGHAEVVQVAYDPDQVSYEQLLDVFWGKHDPTTLNQQGGDRGTQYRSGIYCHSEEQKEMAIKSMEKAQAKFKSRIVTEVAPVSKYTTAEEYHQQYLSKGGRNGNGQNPAKNCKDPIRCYG